MAGVNHRWRWTPIWSHNWFSILWRKTRSPKGVSDVPGSDLCAPVGFWKQNAELLVKGNMLSYWYRKQVVREHLLFILLINLWNSNGASKINELGWCSDSFRGHKCTHSQYKVVFFMPVHIWIVGSIAIYGLMIDMTCGTNCQKFNFSTFASLLSVSSTCHRCLWTRSRTEFILGRMRLHCSNPCSRNGMRNPTRIPGTPLSPAQCYLNSNS